MYHGVCTCRKVQFCLRLSCRTSPKIISTSSARAATIVNCESLSAPTLHLVLSHFWYNLAHIWRLLRLLEAKWDTLGPSRGHISIYKCLKSRGEEKFASPRVAKREPLESQNGRKSSQKSILKRKLQGELQVRKMNGEKSAPKHVSLAKSCVLCRRNTLFQLLHFGVKRHKKDIKIVPQTFEFAIHG